MRFQDSVGKFTFICHFKRVDIAVGTFSLPTPSSLLRHPIFMKVTVPFWFYGKLVRSNAEKYPGKLDKLFTLRNIASLQGIEFTLDFGCKINETCANRHLLKSDARATSA